MGTHGIEIVDGEEKIIFLLGRLEQLRQNKNLLYQNDKPNEPTKEDPIHLSFSSQQWPPLCM
jgi:hypothetical protein